MSQSINAEVVPPTESNLRLAADLVRGGGVIVTPSDTNLALTMDPWNSAAIRRAFAIKRRPATSPLTLFLCHPGDWARYTTVPEHLRAVIDDLVDAFWPGPFNIVLPRNELVSDDLVCGGPTVALGCLSNPTVAGLLEALGTPVAMTSANLSGQADGMLVDLEIAVAQIGSEVDLIVEGGSQGTTTSSTIVTCAVEPFVVLRPGDVTVDRVREVLAGRVEIVER